MDKFNQEAYSQIPPDLQRAESNPNPNNEQGSGHSPTRVEINSKIRGSQQEMRSSKHKHKRNSQGTLLLDSSQNSSKLQVRKSVKQEDKNQVLNSKKLDMLDAKSSKRGSKPSITSKFNNDMIILKSNQNISCSDGFRGNRNSVMSSSAVSQIFYMGMDLLNSNYDNMMKCEEFDQEEVLHIGITLNKKR